MIKNKEKNKGFFCPSFFLKTRRGELTTQQIIMIIILIISFVVVLYFIFRLNPAETSSKQICYNSVALINKGKGLIGSLDCKTNYLCLSGGDSCKEFNPTNTINIDTAKKDEILKALADEMTDCWWMFGEGKIDYASGLFGSSTHCAICSRVKFDEKIAKNIKEIYVSELYNYMKTHQSPHDASQTYLSYLYGVNEIGNLKFVSSISTSSDYLIITGIDPEFPFIFSDKNVPVHLLKSDEVAQKTGCQIFDITQAA